LPKQGLQSVGKISSSRVTVFECGGSRTKWYGQNGRDKVVYGQNGIGQNGTDKMARSKRYTDKIHSFIHSRIYKNGTVKIANQLINPAPTDNMNFSLIPHSL